MRTVLLLMAATGIIEQVRGQESSPPPLETVTGVDIKRYVGRWYEIARLPNRFQEDCAGDVTATYSLREDGEINVVNRCRKSDGEMSEAEGRAKRADREEPPSKLKVRFAPAFLSFLPFVWGDYWIIDLAPDYSYAVVGEPDRRYFWVLSRTTTMEEAVLQEIFERSRKKGYDLSTAIRTRHSTRED